MRTVEGVNAVSDDVFADKAPSFVADDIPLVRLCVADF